MPRHLENNHKQEELVIKASLFEKGSVERRKALREIVGQGDYKENVKNLKTKSGQVVVARLSKDSTLKDYVPCTICLQLFHQRTLYKHSQACFMRPKDENGKVKKVTCLLKVSRALLNVAISDDSFTEIHSVLAKMKRNELHMIIRTDQAFLLYGTIQLQKKEEDRYSDIRFSLRCLARLLQLFRQMPGKDSARGEDLTRSQNYDIVLQCTKKLSVYVGPKVIKTPSLFLKIGFCLNNLIEYLRCTALKERNQDRV